MSKIPKTILLDSVAALISLKGVDPVTLIDVVSQDDIEVANDILVAIDRARDDRDLASQRAEYLAREAEAIAKLKAGWLKDHPDEVKAFAEYIGLADHYKNMKTAKMAARPAIPAWVSTYNGKAGSSDPDYWNGYEQPDFVAVINARAQEEYGDDDEFSEGFWREKSKILRDASWPMCRAYTDAVERWEDEHPEIVAAEQAVKEAARAEEDRVWRLENPEEAAEQDREEAEDEAKRAAELAKRLAAERKAGKEKTLATARKAHLKYSMEGDRDDAKAEARENGDRWADVKEDWEAQWLEENWDEDAQAEFAKTFDEQWAREHEASS
jgi:hypothetical protein